jgi:homoserine kinase
VTVAGPSFRAAPVRVRVPASAANLGPGFDAFGLALGLYDDVVAKVGESGVHVDVAGEGADDVPRDRRNLVVRAMRAAFDLLGGQPRGIEVVCANRIPHGRGLGSSAAAIVAGVLAARELVLGGLPDDDVLALCTEIEGHPDNVAACLLGGFTLAWRTGDQVDAVRLPVSRDVSPVAFVPGSKSSTAKARRLLPDVVAHADAAVNAGRAALLVEALGRRTDLLMPATEDLLHQPYRAEAMPRSATLMKALRDAGIPAVVSGAGPTVLAFGGADFHAGRGWTATPLPVADGAEVLAV